MIINLLEDDNAFLAMSMDEKLGATVPHLGSAKELLLVEVREIKTTFSNNQFEFEGRNFVMVYVSQDDVPSVFLTSTWYNVSIANVVITEDAIYDIGPYSLYGGNINSKGLTFYKVLNVDGDDN